MSRDSVDSVSGPTVEAENSRPLPFSFGRQLRLLKPAEYAAVFGERRVLRGTSFALHYRPNGLAFPRLGLVIPKKQARTAVLRNAIKRQARELFRRGREELPAMDVILRLVQAPAKPVGDPRARASWRAEITVLFDRLGSARFGGGSK